MKPFLLLQVRPEDIAARDEYIGFLETMNLSDHHLVNIRIHEGNLSGVNLDLFSGVILGGGPPNISDEIRIKSSQQIKMEDSLITLMDEIIQNDIPFLGVCYGHGILAVHQEGYISKKYGEPFGYSRIELTKEGRVDDICEDLNTSFDAFVGHKESVEILPDNAVLLGRSVTCPVQIFRVKNNIYGVQFHPELDQKSLKLRAKVYKDSGYFPPDEVQDIFAKIESSNVTEAKKILRNFSKKYAQRV